MSFLSRMNYVIDKSCSLLVGSAVAVVDAYCVLHYTTSIFVPVFTANACLTAGLSKGLKRLINQSRPVGAPKLSPGMPSNHATSLSFLCVSTVFALQRYWASAQLPGYTPTRTWSLRPVPTVPDIPSAAIRPLQAFLVVYSLYATGLRVVQGHHTPAQVVVGYTFGACCAAVCLAANYAGYTGTQPGGRVDELTLPVKTAVVAVSTLVGLLAARSIYRGATHGRRAVQSAASAQPRR